MELTFEQALEILEPQQTARLAKALWEGRELPQGLTPIEKTVAFGLYTYVQYEQREELKRYFEA